MVPLNKITPSQAAHLAFEGFALRRAGQKHFHKIVLFHATLTAIVVAAF
jgi:hypothetical protein